MSRLLRRLTSLTHQMSKAVYALNLPGCCGFFHDVTFGKGEISILTNRADMLNFYYKMAFPIVCTGEEGRLLDSGIYLTQNLSSYGDYQKVFPFLARNFSFQYALHILERDVDHQHLYTFQFNLKEADFLHLVLNKIDYIKHFLKIYRKKMGGVIEVGMLPKNRLILPFGEDAKNKINEISRVLFSNPMDTLKLIRKNTQISLSIPPKQARCLMLLSKGYSAKQIALEMGLSIRTVEHYLERLRQKLACRSSKEMIALYYSQIPQCE